jgi:uncharacterized protein YukE
MADKRQPRDIEGKLTTELQTVRQAGLHGYSTRVHRLEAMLWIAQSVGQGATNYAKVLNIWHKAAAELGEVYEPVTLALYGVSRNAQHMNRAHRTTLAWEIFCAKEKEYAIDGVAREIKRNSFNTNEVRHIKADIFKALLQLVDEIPSRI